MFLFSFRNSCCVLTALVALSAVSLADEAKPKEALREKAKEKPKRKLKVGRQESASGVRHSFLLCGAKETAIFNEESEVVWSLPRGSRDGVVLPNGNILICWKEGVDEFKKGTQEVVWSYSKDEKNSELGAAWRLENGNTLIIESGKFPRLLEVSSEGEVKVEVALQPDTENAHKQTRMARKLPNGNYLVPHLDGFSVKEYTAEGEVVQTIRTDLEELGGREKQNWPFTAIRLPSGNTLVNLTMGHKSVEFDPQGKVVWSCDTSEVDGRIIDAVGGQRLENGNTIIGSYRAKAQTARVIEVTRDKEVVWEFFHPQMNCHGIHILSTNGEALSSYLK